MIGRIVKIEEVLDGRVLIAIQMTTDDSKELRVGTSVAFFHGGTPIGVEPEKPRRGRPPKSAAIPAEGIEAMPMAEKETSCQD